MDDEVTDIFEPSKTAETIQHYAKVFARLLKLTKADLQAAGHAVSEGEDPSAAAIVHTFREREAGWSKSTARLYRAALTFALGGMGTMEAWEARKLLKRDHIHEISDDEQRQREQDLAAEHDARVNLARREREVAIAAGDLKAQTSGQKAKRLKSQDLARLMLALGESRSRWATSTQLWLMAGYLTGLRPIEWAQSSIEEAPDGEKTLHVKNAKFGNGRAFGVSRKIRLGGLSESEFHAVEQHLRRSQRYEQEGKFAEYYDGCRFLLLSINKRLWPHRRTHATLYTARHMFASDAKSVFSRIEVAALMGHSSDRTAGLHYGKRRFARGGAKVSPDHGDVSVVASLNKNSASTFKRTTIADQDAGRHQSS